MKHVKNLTMSAAILASHRLRTGLTVIGVLVGVAALIIIVSVGNGTQAELRAMFDSMGTDLLVVSSGKVMKHHGHTHQMKRVTTLQESDAEALVKAIPEVRAVAPAVARQLPVKYGAMAAQTTVEALPPVGLAIRGVEIAWGRAYTEQESGARRAIAIIGATPAESLFGREDPVGQLVMVGRLPFRIIGVAKSRGADAFGMDQDDFIFVPLDTGVKRLFHTTYIETLYVQGESPAALDKVEAEAVKILRHRHHLREGDEDDFTLQNQKALMETSLQTSRTTTRLIAGVGAISLVVAGIGILAVMLMSVRERRWEIGLRRAVGARRTDILLQFLFEAALLAIAGAVAGVLTGIVGVAVANHFGWTQAIFATDAAAIACFVSILVGVIFGAYPAHRASLLEPIVALHAPE